MSESKPRISKHHAVFPPDFADERYYRALFMPAIRSRRLRDFMFAKVLYSRARMALVARFFWRMFEEASHGRLTRVLPAFSEQGTWKFADLETFYGREGLLTFWQTFEDSFPGASLAVREFIDPGRGIVIATLGIAGKGGASGVALDQIGGGAPLFFSLSVRDGMCIRWHAHTSKAEALEAAGLSE